MSTQPSASSKPSPKRTLSCAGLDEDLDDILRGINSSSPHLQHLPNQGDDGPNQQQQQDDETHDDDEQPHHQRKRLNSAGSSAAFAPAAATPSGVTAFQVTPFNVAAAPRQSFEFLDRDPTAATPRAFRRTNFAFYSSNNDSSNNAYSASNVEYFDPESPEAIALGGPVSGLRFEPYRQLPWHGASPREAALVRAFGSATLQLHGTNSDDSNNAAIASEGNRRTTFDHPLPSAPALAYPPGRLHLPLQLPQGGFPPPSPQQQPPPLIQPFVTRAHFLRHDTSNNSNSDNSYLDYSDSYNSSIHPKHHHHRQLHRHRHQGHHVSQLVVAPEYEEKPHGNAAPSLPETPQSRLASSSSNQDEEIDSSASAGGETGSEVAASPTPVKWVRDEDERLRAAVARFGGKSWKQIAESLGNGRTDVQCLHRWNKVLKPGLIKGPWTPDEDRVLLGLIAQYGVGKIRWCDIAQHLPGRIGKQCRERWCNHLDANIRKGQWTPEEDETVFRCQQQLGNKWSEIAKLLPGRTENAVKNRYNSAARRNSDSRPPPFLVKPYPVPTTSSLNDIRVSPLSAAAAAAAAERTTLGLHTSPPSSSSMSPLLQLPPGVSLATAPTASFPGAAQPHVGLPAFMFPSAVPSRGYSSVTSTAAPMNRQLPQSPNAAAAAARPQFQFLSRSLSPPMETASNDTASPPPPNASVATEDSDDTGSSNRASSASPDHKPPLEEEDEEDVAAMDAHMSRFLDSVTLALDGDIIE